jgi:Gas vesicle synthesis protein GvpL/GvpF
MVRDVVPDDVPRTGLRNAKVEEMSHERLRCFYSRFEPRQFTALTTEDALQFHAVVNAIFQQAAVVPFRFPTLVEGEAELEEFLRQHSAGYQRTLTELRDVVQMELLISSVAEASPAVAVEPPQAEQSGTKYLQSRRDAQQRLETAAEEAKTAGGELLQDWKVKSSLPSASSTKMGGLRCYAQIKRGAIESFRQRMSKLTVGSGMKVHVSGPWPATEFMANEVGK